MVASPSPPLHARASRWCPATRRRPCSAPPGHLGYPREEACKRKPIPCVMAMDRPNKGPLGGFHVVAPVHAGTAREPASRRPLADGTHCHAQLHAGFPGPCVRPRDVLRSEPLLRWHLGCPRRVWWQHGIGPHRAEQRENQRAALSNAVEPPARNDRINDAARRRLFHGHALAGYGLLAGYQLRRRWRRCALPSFRLVVDPGFLGRLDTDIQDRTARRGAASGSSVEAGRRAIPPRERPSFMDVDEEVRKWKEKK